MNIYQKLIEVRKLVVFLIKDEQGYQYKYVSGSSVLNVIRPKMDELGLLLTTDIILNTQGRFQWDGKDSKGNAKTYVQFVTKITMKLIWINAESPEEKLESIWIASGEDEDPAKADGKAHTYGERYYLLKFFKIPTDNEDPDVTQKSKSQFIKKEEIQAPKGVKSMRQFAEEMAIQKLGDLDKYKAWRVDNGFAEDLDAIEKASNKELEFAKIYNALKMVKK